MKFATKLMLSMLAIVATAMSLAARAEDGDKQKQYLYVLRVAPNMQEEKSWTEADNRAVGAHFARLQKASKTGQVILAGRTTEPLDKTFGLVIFKAENTEAAERFMMEDPAVVAKLMTATLHPYSIALQASAPGTAGLSASRMAQNGSTEATERNRSSMSSSRFFRGRCFADAE